MTSKIAESLRRFVAERAAHRCEYCLLHEADAYSSHQVDHILSRKHGGSSDPDNLAYACLRCNAWKGTDVGSLDLETGLFVKLFNPRVQRWEDHFTLQGAVIEPLTAEGRVTVRVLRLNLEARLIEREELISLGLYPGSHNK